MSNLDAIAPITDIPGELAYDPQREMWVRPLPDGRVEIGATAYGLSLAGPLLAFTPKPRGAEIDRGRGLGTVETGKTVLALHCPLSLTLEESNTRAEENPALIEASPYNEGWMIRGRPRDAAGELAALVDAETYRRHVLAQSAEEDPS